MRLWLSLRDRRLDGYKFVRQFVIGPYVADFACRDRRLVVELDGGQHSENKRDEDRDTFLTKQGYRVLRFWNNDVMSNRHGVLEAILRQLKADEMKKPLTRLANARHPLPANGEREKTTSFSHVDTWVFDLDNTLYPHHLNLWQQVDNRIRDYIARFLDIAHEDAFKLQKDYYKRYGTSMRGLMTEHGMKPDDFLDFVHEIDHSPLLPNPALGAALEALPGRKLILTNGTRKHADAVMKRLDIHSHFEGVFGIVEAELEPKPSAKTYERFLARHGVDPTRSAMFEDLARNLSVPHALGMTTVLVVPEGTREVFREDWELEGRDAAHVDYVTEDLTGFLRSHCSRA